jgi:hypothetical protein
MDECHKVNGVAIEVRGEAPGALELVEAALDALRAL